MRLFWLITFLVVLAAWGFAQAPYDPRIPRVDCEAVNSGTPITGITSGTGRVKILWIVCTADSASLPQSWPIGHDPGQRVCNPVTYRMPSWASAALDSTVPWSLSRYYLDQSGRKFGVYGKVVGRDSITVFKCDPNQAVRPIHSDQSGGTAFFNNIMAKVDSFVDLHEFLPTPSSQDVEYTIFDIYGLAEACQAEGGGVSGLADWYTSTHQTNSLGQFIRVRTGVTCWSVAEQAYTNSFCQGWGVSDPVSAAYWPNITIAAHELGHQIGGFHWHGFGDCNYVDLSEGSHIGCGALDPMSAGNGFRDPENGYLEGEVCPYNPYWRNGINWMSTVTVDHPLMNYVMTDHLQGTSNACLKFPSYRSGQGSDQYFLATAVTRNKPWDRLWPADGVMIMHANPTQSQNDRRHKRFDVELASGQYTWTERWENVDTTWHCWLDPPFNTIPCSLNTGENELIRNTVTGLDSFDFMWEHNDAWTHPQLAYCTPTEAHSAGTGATFFGTGRVFSDTSNPSAAVQRNTSPWAQDLPTMAGIQVLNVDHWAGTCTVNATSRHWSGVITTSALWLDSVVVDDNLTIATGTTLTINPGTKIRIAPEKSITVNGKIIANGTAAAPIVFDRSGATGLWTGLSIRNSADPANSISYATVRNAVNGISVSNSRATISYVTAENCQWNGVGFARSTGTLSHCTLQNDSVRGALLFRSSVAVHDNLFSGNGVYGLRIWGCDQIPLSNNIFQNNGGLHRADFAYWPGLEVLEGAVTLTCNSFDHNAGPAMLLLPQAYGDMGTSARNKLSDNMQALNLLGYDYGQIYLQGGTADLYCGENTISDAQNAHTLIDNEIEIMPPDQWQAGRNFWGTTNRQNILSRLPASTVIDSMLSATVPCTDPPPTTCVIAPDYLLFKQGWDQERAAQFADAVTSYENYLLQYPGGTYKTVVTDRLLVCKSAIGWSWKNIRSYFQDLAADSSKDSSLVTLCKSNAAWCLAEDGDYTAAQVELDSLLDHTNKAYDRLALSLKLLMAEVQQDDIAFGMQVTNPGGSRRGVNGGQTDASLASETMIDRMARVEHRLDSVLTLYAGHGTTLQEETLPVPTRYGLFQNYPNPFNPQTEIRFDLPEAVQVELKVYNSLGQLVSTLVNESRPAGSYTVTWDGRHLASGMYLCQIKAGNFTATKKMLLMK
ncbi:MAG TPA: right-handed parallel beta-helix repeat-containing protein [bacterium]|jgi:parallel beta-helix repeat protein